MGMCLSGNVPKWECVRGQGRWTKDVLQVFDERMLIQRTDGYNQKASDGPTLGQLIQSGRSRRRCGSSPGTDTGRVGGAVRRRIVSVSQLHAVAVRPGAVTSVLSFTARCRRGASRCCTVQAGAGALVATSRQIRHGIRLGA